jgi:hypothetical protein
MLRICICICVSSLHHVDGLSYDNIVGLLFLVGILLIRNHLDSGLGLLELLLGLLELLLGLLRLLDQSMAFIYPRFANRENPEIEEGTQSKVQKSLEHESHNYLLLCRVRFRIPTRSS